MDICSICGKAIEREDAPVLTISGYGNPRYLCDECSAEMDLAMSSRDPEEIEANIKVLGDKMNACNDDHAAAAMYSFIGVACDRLVKIKEGTYDFSVDEKMKEMVEGESSFDEIPEELQETEEDKLLDEKEAAANAKFDKLMNKLWIVLGAGAGAYIIWKLISTYLIK